MRRPGICPPGVGHCLQGPGFCCGQAPKAQGGNRKWASGCNHNGGNRPLTPIQAPPRPMLCATAHPGLYPPHSLPTHLPLPPTDLRRTWVRSGCLARSPPLLPLLSSGYLLGISVTLSRGKVTIRFSLNRWLARSPAPAALQERWLDVRSAGAKPKPQPRYCHQLRSHVTLQGWDHGKELWKRPDSDSNLGTASCQLCDPGQIT